MCVYMFNTINFRHIETLLFTPIKPTLRNCFLQNVHFNGFVWGKQRKVCLYYFLSITHNVAQVKIVYFTSLDGMWFYVFVPPIKYSIKHFVCPMIFTRKIIFLAAEMEQKKQQQFNRITVNMNRRWCRVTMNCQKEHLNAIATVFRFFNMYISA